MIIQRRGTELLLIRQGDHAALAAEIMRGWQADGLPGAARREAILTAAREHDDGWREEDAELHVAEDGTPQDFMTVPAGVKRRIWPRAVTRLARRSPYVAALVAQHALTIYAQQAGEAWAAFSTAMRRLRDAHLPDDLPDREFAADYAFVRTGDLLSLMFCNGWAEPQEHAGYRAILRGITLQITPDPFGGRAIPLHVDARAIPARPYRSREDLQEAFAAAPLVRLDGVAAGA